MVSATTGDMEGSKQACVKGTSPRRTRETSLRVVSSKNAPARARLRAFDASMRPKSISCLSHRLTEISIRAARVLLPSQYSPSFPVELRESATSKQKRKTLMVPVPKDGALVYGETFVFDVAPGHAGELRVQLFKKREGIVADSKAVVANAGVYVKNIVTHITAHGAIDKDFKLFSKGGEASGGFVRLRVLYEAIADETVDRRSTTETPAGDENADPANENAAAAKIQASWKGKKTRDVTRESLAKEKQKNAGHKTGPTGPMSPASVAKACGVVAVAALAASVRVARGRRKRSDER